jgi:hypothetical protein
LATMEHRENTPRRKSHAAFLIVLSLGLILALSGNVYQFVRTEHMQRDLALVEVNTKRPMAKLTDEAAAMMEENQQRFEALKNQLQGQADASLRQAKAEAQKSASQVQRKLDQKHQMLASQLSGLKEDTSSKLDQVSDNLGKVNDDLGQTGSDLKRVIGDLGVMSGQVATNSHELDALKELGDRNYVEFELTKTKQPQKVGDIRIRLKKTDPKHNRYTIDVLADDKTIEKKDRSVNEPVQLYMAGSRQPYEIVVNEVRKNEVAGYLATPRVRIPRGQATE